MSMSSVCSDLADLGGVIDCYSTLAKSHLSVAVMKWESTEVQMTTLLRNKL